jgi:protein-tyrosine phosphatase
MPDLIDWQRVSDPRAAVRRAVEELRAGKGVIVPTESGYRLAASGLAADAVARLAGPEANGDALVIAVRGAGEARDWAPGLGRLALRLARRSWPGPLALVTAAGVERGLASRLPEAVRSRICPTGAIHVQAPAHEVVQEMLRHLAGPLVLFPGGATSSGELLQKGGDWVEFAFDDGPRSGPPPTLVQVEGETWRVVRPGAVADGILAQRAACLVVFVCTGNTCRSPLAEALFKKALADRLGCGPSELPGRGFFVLSSGLAAMMGGAAAAEAVEVAHELGADLAGHRSRPLSPDLALQADFLVAMTREHLEALTHHYPRLGTSPRLLDAAGGDIPDPIGQDRAVYQECGRQILRYLDPLLEEVAPDAVPGREPEKEGA